MKLNRRAAWIGCSVCLLATLLLLPPESAGQPGQQDIPDGTKADVMFVLDITGSMQFAITGVEKGLDQILKKFKDNGIDARVGLTVFRDTVHSKVKAPNDLVAGIKADPWTFKFKGDAFTSNGKEFRTVVNKLQAQGGGDIPENSLEAIKHAAENPTRKGVSRIMVLITDAPPHPGPTLNNRIVTARDTLVANKYHHVYLMTTQADRPLYEQIWHKKDPHVDGVFFEIPGLPAAAAATFDDLLVAVNNQAVKDVIAKRKKVGLPPAP